MGTLGETARVKISQETLQQTINTTLDPLRRKELQNEAIKAFIRSKPSGTRITLNDFKRVTSITSDGGMDNRVKSLMRRGVIRRHNITPKTFSYEVLEDVKSKGGRQYTMPEYTPIGDLRHLPSVSSEVVKTEDVKTDFPVQLNIQTSYTVAQIKEKAMRFSWSHEHNNNDLRRFISWLEEQK